MLVFNKSKKSSQLMTAIALATVTGFSPLAVQAKEMRYKEMAIDLKETDRLVVSVMNGKVKLVARATGEGAILRSGKSIADNASAEDMVRYEELSFNVRRSGDVVTVEWKGPAAKEAYLDWLKLNGPELTLEIEAPSVPTEISLHDGEVQLSNWKQSVSSSIVSGQFKSAGGEGMLKIQMQKGEAKVERHKGQVEADLYGAKLTASKIEGDVKVTNYAGQTQVADAKGTIEFLGHSGATTFAKSSGVLEFATGRGAVAIQGFEGPVRGQSDLGPINATVEGESEVAIDTNQGNVAVRLPASSGAALALTSEEGGIYPPEEVRVASPSSGRRSAQGRLNGEGPKGTVSVKTKSGTIRVK